VSDDQNLPTDPVSDLRVGAIALFELYTEYKDVGFTSEQAMKMLCSIIMANARTTP
jgi:hypothetical protein